MEKKTASFLIVIAILAFGCTSTDSKGIEAQAASAPLAQPSAVEKIEIYHFHATQQCYSCKTVGTYAEETVKTYFPEELESGKITFASLNVEEGFNMGIADRYGATGSSLWIGVYDASGFHPEQNTNVWYKIDDKQGYMEYLKGVIDKRLAGDMS